MPGLSSLKVNIKDQPHNLAWINEAEQDLLKDLGGSGRPGPMGIPAYDFDDFDDPEGVYDDPTGNFEGGAQQASDDAIDGYVEDSGPPAGYEPKAMTEKEAAAKEEEFFSTNGVRDDEFFNKGTFQNIAGPNWKTPTTGPNAGTVPGDFIEVSPKSVNWDPGSPIAAGFANFIQGLLPGGTLTSMAGMKIGDALFGPGMVEVNHDGTPKESSIGDFSAEDVGDDIIIPPVEEEDETEEEEELGTMEQFFVDRDAAQGLNQNEVLNNMIDRLGIQNRTIEPFNQWLAGQSEAMRAADMATQTNEYRKTLRDQTSPAQSYLPRVQPAADRTIEQSFINNLYPSSKKTSATDALYAELGI